MRPILIVGCPRSGTSLVRDLLRAHSRITIPGETRVLPAFLRAYGDPCDTRAARRLASDLLATSGVRQWQLDLAPGDLQHHRSFSDLVGAMYDEWARSENKPRWGEKTPQYVLDLPALRRVFPGGQVVHVIRDPRAVTASLLQRPWGPATTRSAARAWCDCVQTGRRDGRALGPTGYHELHYEALLADPEPVLQELCAYLEERYEPQMLRPNRLPRGASPVTWKPGGDTRILPGSPAHDALGRRDREAVAWEAGDLMEQFGYGPAGPRRPPFTGERACSFAADRVASVRFRFSTADRSARLRETVALSRSRLSRLSRVRD